MTKTFSFIFVKVFWKILLTCIMESRVFLFEHTVNLALRFVSTEEKKSQGCKRDNTLLIQRRRNGGATVSYRVIDNPTNLASEDWCVPPSFRWHEAPRCLLQQAIAISSSLTWDSMQNGVGELVLTLVLTCFEHLSWAQAHPFFVQVWKTPECQGHCFNRWMNVTLHILRVRSCGERIAAFSHFRWVREHLSHQW